MRALGVLLALLLPLVGCTGPLPQGREVDARAALELVYATWSVRPSNSPRVYIVEQDPACTDGGATFGFVDPLTGACVGGFALDREAIYLVEEDTYSETGGLAHELLHILGHHHPDAPDWAPGSREAMRIEAANAALKARPELDRISGEVVK